VSVVLFAVSGVLRRRTSSGGPRAVERGRSSPAATPKRAGGDDDLSEIEDILKRHGIS